jgi:hypothetical protein
MSTYYKLHCDLCDKDLRFNLNHGIHDLSLLVKLYPKLKSLVEDPNFKECYVLDIFIHQFEEGVDGFMDFMRTHFDEHKDKVCIIDEYNNEESKEYFS